MGKTNIGPLQGSLSRTCGTCHTATILPDQFTIGGESGGKRRELDLGALAGLIDQADSAGIKVFVKQDSALKPGQQGRISAALWSRKELPA